jgi:hypothetical protein
MSTYPALSTHALLRHEIGTLRRNGKLNPSSDKTLPDVACVQEVVLIIRPETAVEARPDAILMQIGLVTRSLNQYQMPHLTLRLVDIETPGGNCAFH